MIDCLLAADVPEGKERPEALLHRPIGVVEHSPHRRGGRSSVVSRESNHSRILQEVSKDTFLIRFTSLHLVFAEVERFCDGDATVTKQNKSYLTI